MLEESKDGSCVENLHQDFGKSYQQLVYSIILLLRKDNWPNNSFSYSPRTISLETASMVPKAFLILILTSPPSFRWHLVSLSWLPVEEVSMRTVRPGRSSSSSLNHWTVRGSPPEKGSFHSAVSPALTMTGLENLPKASRSILGGSVT